MENKKLLKIFEWVYIGSVLVYIIIFVANVLLAPYNYLEMVILSPGGGEALAILFLVLPLYLTVLVLGFIALRVTFNPVRSKFLRFVSFIFSAWILYILLSNAYMSILDFIKMH